MATKKITTEELNVLVRHDLQEKLYTEKQNVAVANSKLTEIALASAKADLTAVSQNKNNFVESLMRKYQYTTPFEVNDITGEIIVDGKPVEEDPTPAPTQA